MSIYLNNRTRNGLSVSQSIADEILNGYNKGYRNIDWHEGAYDAGHAILINICPDKLRFSFEGGTVVTPHLINLCEYDQTFADELREHWVVTYCDVKYYKTVNSEPVGDKVSERWGYVELDRLIAYRYWRSPVVQSLPVLLSAYPKLMDEHLAKDGYTDIAQRDELDKEIESCLFDPEDVYQLCEYDMPMQGAY